LKAQALFDNALKSFFEILIRRLLGAMSTFHFVKVLETKKIDKMLQNHFFVNSNNFMDFGAFFNSVASKENKLAHFQFKS
jgi:hypothetical protein